MEGKLGGLGERANQDEHGGDGRLIAGDGAHLAESRRACDIDENKEAGEQDEATCDGDQQRPTSCGHRRAVGGLRADEQERGDRRGLPEQEERPNIVGPDEAEHGAAEREQGCGEASAIATAEIAVAVDEDEDAATGDEDGEQGAERPDPEADGEIEALDPVEAGGVDLTSAEPGSSPHRTRQRRRKRDSEGRAGVRK